MATLPVTGVGPLEGEVEAVDRPELLDDGGDLVGLERLLVITERRLLERLQRLPEALHSHVDPLQTLSCCRFCYLGVLFRRHILILVLLQYFFAKRCIAHEFYGVAQNLLHRAKIQGNHGGQVLGSANFDSAT